MPLFIKDDHASLIDVYKRTLSGESLESTLTFTSGVTCHFTSLPKRNDRGEIIGTFGVARDITDRLMAEQALQISEDRLKKAQEAAKIGNWEYDVSTGKVWGSEEAFRIYGIERTTEYLPLDEVENQILEAERVNQALVDLITKGEDYDIEFQITQKNSRKLVTIHSIADLIKDDEGNPVKVIGVIQDITDKKVKEEEHIKLLGQLQQAQKLEAIGTLAGGIAHDFNNILFPIVGYTEMLIDEAGEEGATRDWLNMILNSAMRARDLVQQILAFSRQQEQKVKPLKVDSIVKEALKLMRASFPSTIEIALDIADDCGPVMADPTNVYQIIMNLCTNSYHAMEKTGGRLGVTLSRVEQIAEDVVGIGREAGPYLCLKVEDTGHGMEKEVLERIFDPYYTTKDKGKGTGLGLAVVHGIVHGYGGAIRVQSEIDAGTVFQVYLPMIETEAPLQITESASDLPKGHEKILVVDDEEPIIKVIEKMLGQLGYVVTSYTSSSEALLAFRRNPEAFDLVITDMTMPRMTGDEMAVKMMKVRHDIPVILCTGHSEKITEEDVLALGIRGFLQKPIQRRNLAEKIRKVLDERFLSPE